FMSIWKRSESNCRQTYFTYSGILVINNSSNSAFFKLLAFAMANLFLMLSNSDFVYLSSPSFNVKGTGISLQVFRSFFSFCFLVSSFKWIRALNNRSEEHTSDLQSRENLVCRLLLEKKKKDMTQ